MTILLMKSGRALVANDVYIIKREGKNERNECYPLDLGCLPKSGVGLLFFSPNGTKTVTFQSPLESFIMSMANIATKKLSSLDFT